jgi:hypothetical protein
MQEQSKNTEIEEIKEKPKVVTLDTKKYSAEEHEQESKSLSYYLITTEKNVFTNPQPTPGFKDKPKKSYTRPTRYFDIHLETPESTDTHSNQINSFEGFSEDEDNLSALLKKDWKKVKPKKVELEKPKKKLFDLLDEISKRERVVHINFNEELLRKDFIAFNQPDWEINSTSKFSDENVLNSSASFECENEVQIISKNNITIEAYSILVKKVSNKCTLCKNFSHTENDCILTPQIVKRKDMLCRFCGKTGHLICPFSDTKYMDFLYYNSDNSVSDSDDESFIKSGKMKIILDKLNKYVYNINPICSYCGGSHLRKNCDKSGFEYTNTRPEPSVEEYDYYTPLVQRFIEYEDFSN